MEQSDKKENPVKKTDHLTFVLLILCAPACMIRPCTMEIAEETEESETERERETETLWMQLLNMTCATIPGSLSQN